MIDIYYYNMYSHIKIEKIPFKDCYYIYINFDGDDTEYIEFIINDINIIDNCITKYSDYEYVKSINKTNTNEIEKHFNYVNICTLSNLSNNGYIVEQSIIKIINYDNKRIFESCLKELRDTGPDDLLIDYYDITNEIIYNNETCYVIDYFDIHQLLKNFTYNDKSYENSIIINKIPEMYDKLKKIGVNLPLELKGKNKKLYYHFLMSSMDNIKLLENIDSNNVIVKQYNCKGELDNYYTLKKCREKKYSIETESTKIIKYIIKNNTSEIMKGVNNREKKEVNVIEKIIDNKKKVYVNLTLEFCDSKSLGNMIIYDKNRVSNILTYYKKQVGYYGKESNIEKIIVIEETENGEKKALTYCISLNNQIKNITQINNKQKILLINNKDEDFIVGYKLTIDKDNTYCVVELAILSDSLVVPDTHYNKFRTNKCKVLNIGKIYNHDNKNYYYSYKYNTECSICYDKENLVQIRSCSHKICRTCCHNLEKKICPLCKIEFDGYLINENIKEAYSFVYNDFKYVVGETIIIEDFDYGTKICGKGIHYHDKVEDIYIWKEYNEIPEELKF